MNGPAETERAEVLTARWIVPIAAPAVYRGWVRIRGGRIVEHGGPQTLPVSAVDLGDVALFPKLVNAHTHLEFSDLPEPIGSPGIALHDWIGQVIGARLQTTLEQKQAAILSGVQQSAAAGVGLIAEIATPPCDYPASSLPLVKFAEVLGLSQERAEERFAAAVRHNQMHSPSGWSPHAPYSTTRRTIQRCVEQAVAMNRPLAMHVAESAAERRLLRHGDGPLADSLQSLGVWQPDCFPWLDENASAEREPICALIQMIAAAPRVLLIHGNDLQQDEMDYLAKFPNITVVYCPRTHAFFGYEDHPVDQLLRRGTRVAIGTDSAASNPDLNIWSEVQHLLRHRSDLAPTDVLRMATLHGAAALGFKNRGHLTAGAAADFAVVKTTARTIDALHRDCAENPSHPLSHAT